MSGIQDRDFHDLRGVADSGIKPVIHPKKSIIAMIIRSKKQVSCKSYKSRHDMYFPC